MIENRELRQKNLKPRLASFSQFFKLLEVTIFSIFDFALITFIVVLITYQVKEFSPIVGFDAFLTITGIVISTGVLVLTILINFSTYGSYKKNSINKIREKEKILYQKIQFHVDGILNKKSTGKEIPDSP